MEKTIKRGQKTIEKKRVRFEKKCMGWLLQYMHEVRDVVDDLSCEEYTSDVGQTLEKIANELEHAESCAIDMIACMFNAETAKIAYTGQ